MNMGDIDIPIYSELSWDMAGKEFELFTIRYTGES